MSTLIAATVKSNSSSPVAFQNSSGTQIGTLCRAWVNFNGTGTATINAQFNVSSITDHGTGTYTVNFTNAMSDVYYSYFMCGSAVYNGSVFCMTDSSGTDATNAINTGSLGMECRGNGSSFAIYDAFSVTVSIFR
jgi:hypothetical protein